MIAERYTEQLPAQRRQPGSDRMNDGLRTLSDRLAAGREVAIPSKAHSAGPGAKQLERSWSKEFAHPLIDKRKGCDRACDVAELHDLLLTQTLLRG